MIVQSALADRIEAALREVDVWADDTPNLNAWPQPRVRREFSEWLAARICGCGHVDDLTHDGRWCGYCNPDFGGDSGASE